MLRDPIELALGTLHQSQSILRLIGTLAGNQFERVSCGQAQVFEVGETVGTFGEFRVFATARGCCFNLRHRDAQVFCLAEPTITLGNQHVEFGLVGLPALVDLLIGAQDARKLSAGEPVERLALSRRRPESNLIGLPVHHHQLLPDLVEHADGGGAPADNRATAALGGNGAAKNKFGAVHVATGISNPVGNGALRIDLPVSLNHGPTATRTDGGSIGALPQQQPEGGDHHGLARAGLPRDGGESGA